MPSCHPQALETCSPETGCRVLKVHSNYRLWKHGRLVHSPLRESYSQNFLFVMGQGLLWEHIPFL